MNFSSILTAVFLALLVQTASLAGNKPAIESLQPSVERGRYLVKITGCNDCHTPMYGPLEGKVAEKEWLSGVPVGWKGGWGTTYATNLRQRAASMTEDQWVQYLKSFKSRPPMPYFAVNALKESDSRSMYRFIRSLGSHPQVIPTALPPGEKPKTPYISADVVSPEI